MDDEGEDELDAVSEHMAGKGGALGEEDGIEDTIAEECELTRAEMLQACEAHLEAMVAPLIRAATACQVQLKETASAAAASKKGGSKKARSKGKDGKARAARPSLRGRRLDRVLLVGAASRMPAVATALHALTGVRPEARGVPPERAVVLGAAVQAGMLEGSIEQLDVFNALEAAMIRGVMRGAATTQSERRR